MARGEMDGARDKTAVLCTRVKQALNGTLSSERAPSSTAVAQASEGDWFCPKCADLQFRRNDKCRKCGEPNPLLVPVEALASQSRPEVANFLAQDGVQAT